MTFSQWLAWCTSVIVSGVDWMTSLILTNSFSFLVRREVVNLHFLKNSLTSI